MGRRFNREWKSKRALLRVRSISARNSQPKNILKTDIQVLNLSKYGLTRAEHSLLSKGLKFIPSPKSYNVKNTVLRDFDEFARKLRCTYLFSNSDDNSMHPFRQRSGYKPEPTCDALENYIDKTKLELTSMPIKRFQDNLTKHEREAFVSLNNNLGIVIKKADKSNTVVVMDRDQYISEGMRQLNSAYYVEVEKPDLEALHQSIQSKVFEMYQNKTLDKETYRFLSTHQNVKLKSGSLYLLPKIHKINEQVLDALLKGLCSLRKIPPGRPIISQCGTPTENIGHYCDHFLVPIVQKQNSHIKDTSDFIQKIESLIVPEKVILVTYDVTSMYTNMEFDELLHSVEKAYLADNSNLELPRPCSSDLIFFLRCILENIFFEFNGRYYKQIIGAAMGARPSPEITDIRMKDITDEAISKFKHADKIIYHGRFRDDGFILFNGSPEEIKDFFDIGNSCHKYLRFTYEISHTNVNFLDTTVYKGTRFSANKRLDIRSYIKPTNSFQYLHRLSAHSPSVFKGLIKGECIRHLRNTSNQGVLHTILNDFQIHLEKRGYKQSEIEPIIQETLSANRKDLLRKQKKENNGKAVPTVLVTKFNPCTKGLKKRILKYWNYIQHDEVCNDLFKTPPMVAYSRHKNIGDLIVRSKLKPRNS